MISLSLLRCRNSNLRPCRIGETNLLDSAWEFRGNSSQENLRYSANNLCWTETDESGLLPGDHGRVAGNGHNVRRSSFRWWSSLGLRSDRPDILPAWSPISSGRLHCKRPRPPRGCKRRPTAVLQNSCHFREVLWWQNDIPLRRPPSIPTWYKLPRWRGEKGSPWSICGCWLRYSCRPKGLIKRNRE